MTDYLADGGNGAVPLTLVTKAEFGTWLGGQPSAVQAWVEASGFSGSSNSLIRIPDGDGRLARVVAGIDENAEPWSYGDLPAKLGVGLYEIDGDLDTVRATHAAIGWGLGTYAFSRYRRQNGQQDRKLATLVWPKSADRDLARRTIEAVSLVRDLVNTPAIDLGPEELAEAVRQVGRRHRARVTVTVGEELLAADYPAIYMVGRASDREPRLIDLRWGKSGDPKVTLVGKGVCFDTGGLDIKPSAGMLTMKKDMGGAANMLGLASMIMDARLPVRLRLLIPAVENSISGSSIRPLDVIKTRKGITVEVGNTDAEGRIILCDALAEADSEQPDLLLDAATLTGAARVALGPDLPALFSNDDTLAADLLRHAGAEHDPVWRLPLYPGYRKMLDSDVADINNVSSGGFAGAITAALYLQTFVSPGTKWAHVDMFAWNQANRPGRPRGGEAQFIRGAFAMLQERYGR